MWFSAEEQVEGDAPTNCEFPPLNGHGTMADPFRPAAFDDTIHYIADRARETGEPQYCIFEESYFRVNPDGTEEWSHNMPPLRDNIAEIITEALRKWRKQIGQPQDKQIGT